MAGASVKVSMRGDKKMKKAMAKNPRVFAAAMEKNIRKAGELVIGEARQQFKGSRTRALFEISGGRRKARKEKRPITSPANKLGVFEGTYRQSISQDVKQTGTKTRRTWSTEIGPTVKYAVAHEFGIGNMPQRQVLTPAVQKTEEQVFKLIGRSLKVLKI